MTLISPAIDYQTFLFQGDNWLPYSLFLPTYITTAWYHGRYRPDLSLEEVAQEARQFAYKVYAPTLFQPTSLSEESRAPFYKTLSEMTSISLTTVQRAQGKLDDSIFFLEFFPNEKKILGRFDTRVTGFYNQPYLAFTQDPSATSISGIFAGALHDYLNTELATPVSYQLISSEVHMQWSYNTMNLFLGYPNFMEWLRQALIANPSLKIFVGMGYFDAATPFATAEYCLDHLGLPASYTPSIQKGYYEGGHMYYLNPKARTKFKQDLVQFYEKKDPKGIPCAGS